MGNPKGVRRDFEALEKKITQGETTVTIVTTPGHTPGTLSMLFTVRDKGKPINVAYSGGTAFQLSQHGAELRYLHHFPMQNGRGCSGGERHHPDVQPHGIR